MEYTGYNSLSPCQIESIHTALEGNNMLRSYLLCNQFQIDRILCDFDPNIVSFFGRKINLNQGCSSVLKANGKPFISIHYSQETEIFNNFESFIGCEFEIVKQCSCN